MIDFRWLCLVSLDYCIMKRFVCFYLFLAVVVFAACNCDAEDEGDSSEEGMYMDDEIFRKGEICVSEDGRVTIMSDMYRASGTSPDYWALWTIIDDKGEKHELKFEYSSCIVEVHSLRKNDGSSYYIVTCFGKACSWDDYMWLEAYRIVGDTINEVNVIDGGELSDFNEFKVEYGSMEMSDVLAGYNLLFDYDTMTQNLYVPLSGDNHALLDRYRVWHFNGDCFEFLGEKPNRNLNQELGEYASLICCRATKDYLVRVDLLDNHELRYASWKKPKTLADKPDVVVNGGVSVGNPPSLDEMGPCCDYHFKVDPYEYVVNYRENVSVSENQYGHQGFLLVKRDGEVILKQELK